jgi:hypothetical protein
MQALLVSSDRHCAKVLGRALRAFGTRLEVFPDILEALGSAHRRRFDATFLDLDSLGNAASLLPVLREIATYRKQVIVSVLQPGSRQPASLNFGTDFSLWKPLSVGRTTQFLRAAYGVMFQEYARYYRHSLQVPAVVAFGIEEIPVIMTNLSAGGLCLRWLRPRTPSGPLRIRFAFPGQKLPVTVDGEVAWTGPSSNVGIRFTHLPDMAQAQMERWLAENMPRMASFSPGTELLGAGAGKGALRT